MGFRRFSAWSAKFSEFNTAYGKDASLMLNGCIARPTKKPILMGKFARVALKTANIDYNGRLCMVSAGAASKKVFGIDRSANPWS